MLLDHTTCIGMFLTAVSGQGNPLSVQREFETFTWGVWTINMWRGFGFPMFRDISALLSLFDAAASNGEKRLDLH